MAIKEPRRYLDKACEALDGVIKASTSGNRHIAADLADMRTYFTTKTQCWTLTPELVKMIWHTDFDPKLFEQIKLPHPAIAVEYEFHNKELGLPAPTGDHEEMPLRCTIVIDRRAAFAEKLGSDADFVPDGLIFYQFYGPIKQLNGLGITPYTTMIGYSQLPSMVTSINEGRKTNQYRLPISIGGLVQSMTIEEMAAAYDTDPKHFKDTLLTEAPMIDDVRIVLGLMQLLSCHNVPVKSILPPEKVNKKRKKRGRPLLRPYLTIKLPQCDRPSNITVSHDETRHVTPHVRRGHLRRQWYPSLQEHRPKWIAPTFVGSDEIPHVKDVVASA
jgi:hypothetical protein